MGQQQKIEMGQGYIRSLDGVRALAIVLVMTFHAQMNHFGWMGVQLFFVLSGFLITGILWKEKFKADSPSQKLKRFWVRRSLRIFPLYFGFLILLGISFLLYDFPSYYTDYIPYLATYTFNFTRTFAGWQVSPLFTHLWSLCIEEQFYLCFPLIVFLAGPRLLKTLMIVVIVLAPLIRYLLGVHYHGLGLPSEVVADSIYWNTLSHLDAFFLGGIIPVFALDREVKQPGKLLASCFCLAIAAGILNFMTSGTGAYLDDLGYREKQTAHYEYIWHYSVLNLLFASTILNLVSIRQKERFLLFRRFLEHPWVVQIGKVSYGMYIFHWAIFYYAYRHFFTTTNPLLKLLLFLPYLLLVYLVAALSYRFYESKFLKLKDRFYPVRRTTPFSTDNKNALAENTK